MHGAKVAAGQIAAAQSVLGANLSGLDLSKHDFSNRDLSNCNLSGCNLSGCNLTGCNLSGANLSGANLQGARLRGSRMDKGTRLAGAAGEPADTGASGVVQGARVLATAEWDSWGSEAPRTGVVSAFHPKNRDYIKVTWDDTGEQSDGIHASTVVLLDWA